MFFSFSKEAFWRSVLNVEGVFGIFFKLKYLDVFAVVVARTFALPDGVQPPFYKHHPWPIDSLYGLWSKQGSLNHQFWRDLTMQMYGNF